MNAPHIDARTRLLDAAEAIAARDGVGALTLDAVAAAARISKGGLLHHFRSKEALLAGLVERFAVVCRAEFEAMRDAVPEGPNRLLRGCIAWTFDQPGPWRERMERMTGVLLAAFLHDPKLIDPIRAFAADLRAALTTEAAGPGAALLVMFATDGMLMNDMFRLHRLSVDELAAMRKSLEHAAQGELA